MAWESHTFKPVELSFNLKLNLIKQEKGDLHDLSILGSDNGYLLQTLKKVDYISKKEYFDYTLFDFNTGDIIFEFDNLNKQRHNVKCIGMIAFDPNVKVKTCQRVDLSGVDSTLINNQKIQGFESDLKLIFFFVKEGMMFNSYKVIQKKLKETVLCTNVVIDLKELAILERDESYVHIISKGKAKMS